MAPPPRSYLPIGISDFRKLREPGVLYVDKTQFVTDVLASHREVELFPRPRRFGKTVNLSTVRHFVERSTEDRSALFEGLSVWGSAEARPHFQRYPVISLTFKDVKSGTFEEAFGSLRAQISAVFHEHKELLDGDQLGPEHAAWYQEILRAEGSVQRYSDALRLLSMWLARRHGERVFVLIDEYDSPIHSMRSPEDERRMLDFLRAFLSGGLKDNPHLFKGLLTGILRVAKESLFSGLNNLAVHSLLRTEHATSFGFTPEEVRALAEKTSCTTFLADIERWYNGYRFGGKVVYNPWSVLCFLDSEDKVFRPYWVHTSSDDLLRRVILAHGLGDEGELETLLQGGEIRKIVSDRVALRDLDRSPEAVWSFLLFTGYLKAVDVRQEDTDTVATLAIPNREVLSVYRTIFRSWLEERLGGAKQMDRLLLALLAGDAEACEQLFGQLLESLSVHDLAVRRASKPRSGFDPEAEVLLTPEQIYHVFVVSVLLGLQPRYAVRSNRESGHGRYDVMVLPTKAGDPGVVLELKVRNRKKRETMKGALSAALEQIRDRGYAAELRAAGATPIHEMAIVFDGKRVKVGVANPGRGLRSEPLRLRASIRFRLRWRRE